MKNKALYLSITVAIVLMALATFSLLMISTPTQAAPPAAPTPLANFTVGGVQPAAFPFQAATAITADTNTAAVEVLRLGAVDVQYVIDHGTVNSTTLTVQYSNDNTNWVNGVALVTDSQADGTDITRVPVFGRWMRINQNVTGADTITITLLAVGR